MGPTHAYSSTSAARILTPLITLIFTIGMLACGTGSQTSTTTNPPPASGGGTGGSGGSGGGTGGSGGSGGGGGSTVATTTEIVVSGGLSVPWSLQFAPDGRLFFTEQRGNLKIFSNGAVTTAYHVSTPGGLDGMTGMALDPNFATNHRLFVFYCTDLSNEHCKLERLIENNGTATLDKVLLDFPTGNRQHIGGRLKFGPDGLLYLTTGDQYNPPLAQDPSILPGKILRMDSDGNAQGGGGFANPYIFAMGFRDPEGLAWDSAGKLYGSDHGPHSNDEINLIEIGKNYGWPTCIGICGKPEFVDPVKLWSPETAAPSGMTFYTGTAIPQWTGSLFVALLGLDDNTYARHLHRLQVNGSSVVSEEELYKGQFGRLRDVIQGPDGFLYFSTSNGDDKIVRVKPQ